MPQLVTEGRVITDEKHLELLNEMLNAKERKEKAKEERGKWEKKNKYKKKLLKKATAKNHNQVIRRSYHKKKRSRRMKWFHKRKHL